MAEIKFSQLTTAAQLTNDDIFALAQMQGGSLSSVKTSMIAVANFLNTQVQYTTAYNTQAKTTAGAINELKQLISLIPQFSIEVVQELPTEDISDTTIYLVPAEDPEVGNYYEEYIHVNNTWELVGTTAVDLSAYYTKLEVDGLLATKASVAEVALKENKSDMPTDVRTIIKDCKTPKSATITNGIAQFECIEENLVKGLKVTMNPIQDLSHGDPSPTNICPISGRTEASVTRTGKNKLDLADISGTETNAYYHNISTDYKLKENVTYTLSFDVQTSVSPFNMSVGVGTESGSYSADVAVKNNNSNGRVFITFTPTQEQLSRYEYLKIRLPRYASLTTFTYSIKDIQLELGSTATAYEPYTAETKTHQYSETIYGGTDDFVNGGLSNEWGYIASYDGETLPGEWISDRDVYAPGTTPTTGAGVAYKLATPTTISTSAEEITTVSDTNIISGTEPISECKYTELATVDDLRKIIGGQ